MDTELIGSHGTHEIPRLILDEMTQSENMLLNDIIMRKAADGFEVTTHMKHSIDPSEEALVIEWSPRVIRQ